MRLYLRATVVDKKWNCSLHHMWRALPHVAAITSNLSCRSRTFPVKPFAIGPLHSFQHNNNSGTLIAYSIVNRKGIHPALSNSTLIQCGRSTFRFKSKNLANKSLNQSEVTTQEERQYVKYYFDHCAGYDVTGCAAHLASQPAVGLLPERRDGTGSLDPDHPDTNRTILAQKWQDKTVSQQQLKNKHKGETP
jgi:hypothetical protein